MSQEEIVRYKKKNKEFKQQLKSQNERFTIDNLIKVKELETLPEIIEKSISENRTPIIIRQSKYHIIIILKLY
jgi:hypothetical protein